MQIQTTRYSLKPIRMTTVKHTHTHTHTPERKAKLKTEYEVLVRMSGNWKPCTLLVGMQNSITTVEKV